ncbi:MAG: hypothetical protein CVU05_03015 [Bacteroidetes bacterium HGW-Bacteroidetes-21]|jgi:hypothetical protein|nr:MAG: hypothetical protein CVU05_03015 [Bacteroidetes bacterium HGW-Bacteroidetes-21]
MRACKFLLFLLLISCTNSGSNQSEKSQAETKPLLESDSFMGSTTQDQTTYPSIVSVNVADTSNLHTTYLQTRAAITEHRLALAQKMDSSDSNLQVTGKYLYTQLLQHIIPPWYGTVWDFNGTSDIPNQGSIACGYFVSTTLKHLGFNLNRYKLAQQYSLKIIELLCGKENTKTWSPEQFSKMISYIKNREEDVYLIGLSCHVGFLSLENDTVYFIHSSYVDPLCVIKEYAETSPVLEYSNVFVTGPLFSNKALVKKWIEQEAITVQ